MIEIHQHTLSRSLRSSLADLLADAFEQDDAMNQLLGAARWRRIARRYFAIQLDYSDTILVAERDDQIIGALLARSPHARPRWQSLWMFLVMLVLLRRHYFESQQVGHALIERLPREPHWYINQLGVLQANQSEGIGTALMMALKEKTGEDLVCVDCEDQLQGFYEAAGFRLLEAVPGHSLRIMANQLPLAPLPAH